MVQKWEYQVKNGKIYCDNFDQREFDKVCTGLTKHHKAVASLLVYRSVHDVLAIIENALEKAFTNEGYL